MREGSVRSVSSAAGIGKGQRRPPSNGKISTAKAKRVKIKVAAASGKSNKAGRGRSVSICIRLLVVEPCVKEGWVNVPSKSANSKNATGELLFFLFSLALCTELQPC